MESQLPAAVLWDMDGTLVDTEPLWREAQRWLVGEYGLEPLSPAQEESLIGSSLRAAAELFRAHGVPLDTDALIRRVADRVTAGMRRRLEWRPGARELVAALAGSGVPCAIVTNSTRSITDAVVHDSGSDWFSHLVTSEDVLCGKPDPSGYLLAAERLGVDARECVAIEDSLAGVQAGVAAGCVTFGVRNEVDLPEDGSIVLMRTLHGVSPDDLGRHAAEHRRRRENDSLNGTR